MFADGGDQGIEVGEEVYQVDYPEVEHIVLLVYILELGLEQAPENHRGDAHEKYFAHEAEERAVLLLLEVVNFREGKDDGVEDPQVVLIGDDPIEKDEADHHEPLTVEQRSLLDEVKTESHQEEESW